MVGRGYGMRETQEELEAAEITASHWITRKYTLDK
jgi:hypothetical protein